jgi:putative addiction module component (TIGR02574 family)
MAVGNLSNLSIYSSLRTLYNGQFGAEYQSLRWFSRSGGGFQPVWCERRYPVRGSRPRPVHLDVQLEAMTHDANELLKKALTLPVAERAELAGSLIESLDEELDQSVRAAWDAEIARRMEDLESGKVEPVSLEEARRRFSSAME